MLAVDAKNTFSAALTTWWSGRFLAAKDKFDSMALISQSVARINLLVFTMWVGETYLWRGSFLLP